MRPESRGLRHLAEDSLIDALSVRIHSVLFHLEQVAPGQAEAQWLPEENTIHDIPELLHTPKARDLDSINVQELLVFECDCVVYQNSRSNDKLQKVRIHILGNLIGYKKKEKGGKME